MAVAVSGLAIAPVKGTRLLAVDEVEIDHDGARGNRRFFVIDERSRMVNAKIAGGLTTVISGCGDGTLSLAFPDGRVVQDAVRLGEEIATRFYSGTLPARLVEGPFSTALSEHLGRTVRLVSASAIDRGRDGGASLISRASLARLAQEAEVPEVDARRFRMLIEIDGVAAHAEDAWVGQSVRIGAATVRFKGHVGRCLVTSRDPETGEVDLPTLDVLGSYRGGLDTTEPLPFGIYGEVLEPGTVRVGDPVAPAG